MAAGGRLHAFNVGVEAEAAGRAPAASFAALRRDLAALPWVLASGAAGDAVDAPPQRAEFLEALEEAGARDLPAFGGAGGSLLACPYGVAGPHLRRSVVAAYRRDVAVCRTREEAVAAVAALARGGAGARPAAGAARAVLKAEFSCAGLGVRVIELGQAPASAPDAARAAAEAALAPRSPLGGWVSNLLRRDGAVTVEPWLDIAAELTVEWDGEGVLQGVSVPIVESMRWQGQWVGCGGGAARAALADDIARFVYDDSGVERALGALNIPATCGVPPGSRCGADVAVLRAASADGAESSQNGFEVVVLEGAAPVDRASTRCARCSALSPG